MASRYMSWAALYRFTRDCAIRSLVAERVAAGTSISAAIEEAAAKFGVAERTAYRVIRAARKRPAGT